METIGSEYTNIEWKKICNEFKRTKDQHYLDHAGTTLYAAAQLNDIFNNFNTNLYANPHTSKLTEDQIDQVRYKILEWFNADANEYNVIFTAGTTAALKLVAECFDFGRSQMGSFAYSRDCHTSVLGMREIVNTNVILCIEKSDLFNMKKNTNDYRSTILPNDTIQSLFVFPAQCNFNGHKYPLHLIDVIQSGGAMPIAKSDWYVCLDAASLVQTSQLDLSRYHPDFVTISFYKIFGYPTGLGALIVSKRGAAALTKKYYGGGTVKIALSDNNWHVKRDCLYERFEDGTLPFLSIISLLSGFKQMEKLIPSQATQSTMARISRHTFLLAQYLYRKLNNLNYQNGQSVIKFYNDTDFKSISDQGPIINFNVLHSDGSFVGFAEIACMAAIYKIILRTGCFCNPGACQRKLQLSTQILRDHYKAGHICGDSNDLIDGIPTGSIRISFGYMTRKEDADTVIRMITECYIQKETSSKMLKTNFMRKLYTTDRNQLRSIEHHQIRSSNNVQLKQICIYPIKSCGAMKISTRWPLTRKGLKYDREWMIVKSNGAALTQKTETKLCLIRPDIIDVDNIMELSFPYMQPIRIELNAVDNRLSTGTLCQTKVCGDRIEGVDCGDEVAEWLSDALCINGLRLLRQKDEDQRVVRKQIENDSSIQSIALSNQAQFLLINRKSVQWLIEKVPDWNDRNQSSVDEIDFTTRLDGVVDRFRGNLIVDGPIELDEQHWNRISFDGVSLQSDGPCNRCQMICIDQWTGEQTAEPLRTIAHEFHGKMRFGLYLSQSNDLATELNDGNEVILRCNSMVTVEKNGIK